MCIGLARHDLDGVLTFNGDLAEGVLEDSAVPGRLLCRRPSESVKHSDGSLMGGGFGLVFNCAQIGICRAAASAENILVQCGHRSIMLERSSCTGGGAASALSLQIGASVLWEPFGTTCLVLTSLLTFDWQRRSPTRPLRGSVCSWPFVGEQLGVETAVVTALCGRLLAILG